MAKNWPGLRLMYGLDKDQMPYIEPDRKKAALKEYFQNLRPDVVEAVFEQPNNSGQQPRYDTAPCHI